MLLTPHFTATQTDIAVQLSIRCPYIKASGIETHIDGPHFRFHCKPYYLSLEFDHALQPDPENGNAMSPHSATYDIANGIVSINLSKLVAGTWFDNLDFIPKLLTNLNKSPQQYRPLIHELVGPEDQIEMDGTEELGDESETEFDWCWDQCVPENDHLESITRQQYGFGKHFIGFWITHQEEMNELLQVPDPDLTSVNERRLAREGNESLQFDEDYYMAGFIEDEEDVQHMVAYVPWWHESSSSDAQQTCVLTQDEQTRIERIIRAANKRPILVSSEHVPIIFLACLDLVSAYCYMMRHDLGDPTVEFAWSVSCIAATLSCLEEFTSPTQSVRTLYRRALTYPLCRSRQLIRQVLAEDVVQLISNGGRTAVLRVLCELHTAFEVSEPHGLWNTLWIEPLSAWITKVSVQKWRSGWAKVFENGWAEKVVACAEGHVAQDWNLDAWENLARTCVEEGIRDCDSSSGSSSMGSGCSSSGDSNSDDCSDDTGSGNEEGRQFANPISSLMSDFRLLDLKMEQESSSMRPDSLSHPVATRKPLIEEL